MIVISSTIKIDDSLIIYEAFKDSGPGGQNVNKLSTAIRIRIPLTAIIATPEIIKRLRLLGHRFITANDEIIIESRLFRSQERNRANAINKLKNLIIQSEIFPKIRLKTIPSSSSQEKRLQKKIKHGQIKKNRKDLDYFED